MTNHQSKQPELYAVDDNEDGLVAFGGCLDTDFLYQAYLQGLFPWYEEPPILWWCPPSRAVITEASLHISRSMHPLVKNCRLKNIGDQTLKITTDTNFSAVINSCRDYHQDEQLGGWINDDMVAAYCQLHDEGHAHSFELWLDEQLTAGIYGVHCGTVFSAESMFSLHTDASKLLLIKVCQHLFAHGVLALDCQVPNEHTTRLGTTMVSRNQYLKLLPQSSTNINKLTPLAIN